MMKMKMMMMKDDRMKVGMLNSSWYEFLQLSGRACLTALMITFCFFILFLTVSCKSTHVDSNFNRRADINDCYDCQHSYESHLEFQDVSRNDVETKHNSIPHSPWSICLDSNGFCFRSILPEFSVEQESCRFDRLHAHALPLQETGLHDSWENSLSWHADKSYFRLLTGYIITSSLWSALDLTVRPAVHVEVANAFDAYDGSLFKNHSTQSLEEKDYSRDESHEKNDLGLNYLEIALAPPALNWGKRDLFSPSISFLTVTNIHNESSLHVYEPFSPDSQFYAFGFKEKLLRPGESVSVAFVYLPRVVGLSSTNLVLQTSKGGLLLHAEGEAIDSPYKIKTLDLKNIFGYSNPIHDLVLHNPFDDVLHIGEVSAWFSITSANASYLAHAVLQRHDYEAYPSESYCWNEEVWPTLHALPLSLPLLTIRPHGTWAIETKKTEEIIEMGFLPHVEGSISGIISLKLWNSSQDRVEIINVPLEAEIYHDEKNNIHKTSLSVQLESLVSCEGSWSIIVSLTVRNDASYSLKVSEITEVTKGPKLFHVKYMKGLLLFPKTVTRVATISCASLSESLGVNAHEWPNLNSDCRLILTVNDSTNSQIEVSCQDVLSACCQHHFESSSSAFTNAISDEENLSCGSNHIGEHGLGLPPSLVKQDVEIDGADEWLLRNWVSQRTAVGLSVLNDVNLFFPTIQVDTVHRKWISVSNPSQQPVVMQLLMNSGLIVDKCAGNDLSLLKKSRQGGVTRAFFTCENGTTEILLLPNARGMLGPIYFRPSHRCVWRSSVLIRNNLTGLEYLNLQGGGGSASLLLLEGSKHAPVLEFNLSFPHILNSSSHQKSHGILSSNALCTSPLEKVVYVKNAGEVPIEVSGVYISGVSCSSDGFSVDKCGNFHLDPGESRQLLVSYDTDHSKSVVNRDLEFVYSSGSLVIPMKATFPGHMFSLCRKSFLWLLIRKASVVISVAAVLTFLIWFYILPRESSSDETCLFKNGRGAITQVLPMEKQKHLQKSLKSLSSATSSQLKEGIARTLKGDETSDGSQAEVITSQHLAWIQSSITTPLPDYREGNRVSQMLSCSTNKSQNEIAYSVLRDSLRSSNLTVRIEKDRSKRKKKKGGGLASKLEGGSSQSGNSTPSSPLSPPSASSRPSSPLVRVSLATLTSNTRDHEARDLSHPVEALKANASYGASKKVTSVYDNNSVAARKKSSNLSVEELHFQPRKTSFRSVLLPSATFPVHGKHDQGAEFNHSILSSSSSYRALSSSSATYARAPGSRLGKGLSDEKKDKGLYRDEELTYDIWGNHFPEFQLMDSPRAYTRKTFPTSDESRSFFARTPEIHLQKPVDFSPDANK